MIALSFDLEEFDLPLEHGINIPFERQISISHEGAHAVLDILKLSKVKATFFTTVNFAKQVPDIIQRINNEGHELASHGMEHSRFELNHLRQSRIELEKLSGQHIMGYRMARMMKLDEIEIAKAGYLYDSSLNPTVIPGRYFNLSTPRLPHLKDGVVQIPASVVPGIRFPMFWLSAHLLPPPIYRALARLTHRHGALFATYFHPWEFVDLNAFRDMKIPAIVRLNSGQGMLLRLEGLISSLKKQGAEFVTYGEVAKRFISSHNHPS